MSANLPLSTKSARGAEFIGPVIERFVNAVGKPKEARFYLEHWRSEHPERFALIEFSAIESRPHLAALATDLAYLASVGLTPLVSSDRPNAATSLEPGGLRQVHSVAEAVATAREGLIAIADKPDLAAWVGELQIRKVVILGSGPLRHPTGEPISILDAPAELSEWLAAADSAPLDRPRVSLARDLLAAAKHSFSVSLASPLELLRELFTVRGSGTLIRRGATITQFSSLDEIETRKLVILLEQAFGKSLDPGALTRPIQTLLVAGEFRGAAIVEPTDRAPYLSKFAVGQRARGEGIGRDLWRVLDREFPRLFWRSRATNPIADWYTQRADGLHRTRDWTVYWRGLKAGELSNAIDEALSRPHDFTKPL